MSHVTWFQNRSGRNSSGGSSNSSSPSLVDDDSSTISPIYAAPLNSPQSHYKPLSFLHQSNAGSSSGIINNGSSHSRSKGLNSTFTLQGRSHNHGLLNTSAYNDSIWSLDSNSSFDSASSGSSQSSNWPSAATLGSLLAEQFAQLGLPEPVKPPIPPQQQQLSFNSTFTIIGDGSVAVGVEQDNSRTNYYPSVDPKDYFCETVAVENASMVAQIVGKGGVKIKHLIAKYGARIRTPNADQEPVFIIKGKRSDVYKVKQEIQGAAAHFMAIEQLKREKMVSASTCEGSSSVKVYIPPQFVGLVIGRNGRIVRELQAAYHVYIETPKFAHRGYFHIFGKQDDLKQTVQEIAKLLESKCGIAFTNYRCVGDEVYFLE